MLNFFIGEKIMRLKIIIAILTIGLTMTTMLTSVSAQTDIVRIEGTWNVVLTSGEFQQQERFTFLSNNSSKEGSLVFTNEVDAVPPCGADQGVWRRSGLRTFSTTHGSFCIDVASGAPAFTTKFRESITLNETASQLTGNGVFEVFDTGGKLLFSAPFTLQGSRMQPEAVLQTSEVEEAPAASTTVNPFTFWRKRAANP
jgi:hypothetical protein